MMIFVIVNFTRNYSYYRIFWLEIAKFDPVAMSGRSKTIKNGFYAAKNSYLASLEGSTLEIPQIFAFLT